MLEPTPILLAFLIFKRFIFLELVAALALARAMRAAGPPRSYLSGSQPLKTLMRELGKYRSVRYIQIERGAGRLVLRNTAQA